MDEEPIPSCLLHPKWTNRDVPPQCWGMRVSQFNDIIASFLETRFWSRWIQEKGYANLYDTDSLVKTWTRGTGCSIALRMNPEMTLTAELMVSHSWAEDIHECREAVDQFVTTHGKLDKTLVIWFCAFANYQSGDEPGDVGPTIAEQLKMDPFGCVIQATSMSQGMLVVHTSRAEVYERLWCVYEIDEALRTESRVGVCFSKTYIADRGGRSLLDLLRAQTTDATCGNPSDEGMIRTKIVSHGGFKALDLKIFEFRLTSLQELMLQADSKLQQELQDELDMAEKVLVSGTLSGIDDMKKRAWMRMIFALVSAVAILGLIAGLIAGFVIAGNPESVVLPEHDAILSPVPVQNETQGPDTPSRVQSVTQWPEGTCPPEDWSEKCNYWRAKYDMNVTDTVCGSHIPRLAVLLSSGACENNVTFQDVQGYNCTNWTSKSCWSADGWGYTLDEAFSVLQNCPVSCGLCNCTASNETVPVRGTPIIDVPMRDIPMGDEVTATTIEQDLAYMMLCVCAAVVGLCVAGGVCLLLRRWHGSPPTSHGSSSQSDLEKKEEMQARFAALKATMQDRPAEHIVSMKSMPEEKSPALCQEIS
eukprot:TRINITY_DN37762_c0_g1_i1.p1 TRINITY_DN37762_c0_g1~~TRINITY_DN37762_c0_g1_i1.p1  ORF type:complete len:589 (+),score=86.54 TRINITY_DN37762_c0_g1_i1:69-1835(+)